MIKFKERKDKEFWDNLPEKCDQELFKLLKWVIEIMAHISHHLGYGGIVITSFIRGDNEKSWHFWARAVDIRVKDKPVNWYVAMLKLGECLNVLDSRIFFQPHYDLYRTKDQHIHIHIGRK